MIPYCHVRDAVKFIFFFLPPCHSSDGYFPVPLSRSTLLQDPLPNPKNPKLSANKQTKRQEKIFNLYFYSPESADPELTLKVKQPCCIIICNPFRFFLNISMKFSHKSPSLLTKCCAVADFARYALM